jgi:hypothetical protein
MYLVIYGPTGCLEVEVRMYSTRSFPSSLQTKRNIIIISNRKRRYVCEVPFYLILYLIPSIYSTPPSTHFIYSISRLYQLSRAPRRLRCPALHRAPQPAAATLSAIFLSMKSNGHVETPVGFARRHPRRPATLLLKEMNRFVITSNFRC